MRILRILIHPLVVIWKFVVSDWWDIEQAEDGSWGLTHPFRPITQASGLTVHQAQRAKFAMNWRLPRPAETTTIVTHTN